MAEITFIQNFIAEFALNFYFVPFFLGMLQPLHHKSIYKGFFGFILMLPFYWGKISFNLYINVTIFFVFILYGLTILIPLIKYKGIMYAIEEYEKKSQKPKYGINDTLIKINNFIGIAFIGCIFSLSSFFFGTQDIFIFFAILFLLLILIIMGNYYMKGHFKITTKLDPKKIKVNLFTLISLTFIFSIMILTVLSFTVSKYFPITLYSYPFIAFIVIIPPYYISNYLLDESRLTFFKNKEIAKIFISNITTYSIISFVFIFVLSDIPVAISVLKGEDIIVLSLWVTPLMLFITHTVIIIIKKALIFGLESNVIDLSNLKRVASSNISFSSLLRLY